MKNKNDPERGAIITPEAGQPAPSGGWNAKNSQRAAKCTWSSSEFPGENQYSDNYEGDGGGSFDPDQREIVPDNISHYHPNR